MTESSQAEIDQLRRQKESLGGSYLRQAAEALRATGSAEMLWPPSALGPEMRSYHDAPDALVLGRRLAHMRRHDHARTAILFAMLAAEAYVNQFLAWHLTGRDLAGADKLPTLDKFVQGPRLAIGRQLLPRGSEPTQTLSDLLALRSRLVHPKLRQRRAMHKGQLDPPDYDTFNPTTAARYIIAVADAVGWLFVNADPPTSDLAVAAVDFEREAFIDHAERADRTLPGPDDRPVQDLLIRAINAQIEKLRPEVDSANAAGTDP